MPLYQYYRGRQDSYWSAEAVPNAQRLTTLHCFSCFKRMHFQELSFSESGTVGWQSSQNRKELSGNPANQRKRFRASVCYQKFKVNLKRNLMDTRSTVWRQAVYALLAHQADHHRAQQIDRQPAAQQTSQRINNDRIPFTHTFHPHNQAVKSIILKNFKLFQNDPDTGRIFSQPPLITFKRDKGTFFSQKCIPNKWSTRTFHLQRW